MHAELIPWDLNKSRTGCLSREREGNSCVAEGTKDMKSLEHAVDNAVLSSYNKFL